MLSAEKLPPDLPCPPPILIKELDLSKQTHLDADDDNNNNPLPKFSIRDYVFSARSKDLMTNWPFSKKNLQRCLRHGVKDVLPPFQSLDSLRNQAPKVRCTVEDEMRLSDIRIAAQCVNVVDDHAVLEKNVELKETKLAEACVDTTTISCRSEEIDLPSTMTSVSQSGIEESAPINMRSSASKETGTCLEAASVKVKAAITPTVANKTGRASRPVPGKKFRLVVKYNSHSDKNKKEDIASNCSTISEPMTSKVCPVCKTFSSSSNTTLNAHIDQCLSGESTPKSTAWESKATTRYRIKPKKTKKMVDIYVTAQHCTLEDLDRRNGSSWATPIASLPDRNKEKSNQIPVEVKRKRVSSVYPEPDDIDVGSVYVDASGTKVRILSKLGDKPSSPASKTLESLRPIKPLNGGKGSKFLFAKKKKQLKYLKLAPQSRNLLSRKTCSSELHEDVESYGAKESCKGTSHQLEKQLHPCHPLALRPWARSKRTAVGKKFHPNDAHQVVESKMNESRNLLVERKQIFLPVEENRVQNFSGILISSPENSSSKNESSDSEASDDSDSSPQKRRGGSPISKAGMSDDNERLHRKNGRQFSNQSSFAIDGDYELMFANSSNGAAASTSKVYGSPSDSSAQPSKGRSAFGSNSMMFPSSKKIASSVGGHLSVTENDTAFVKKTSGVVKSRVHERSEIDRDVDRDSECNGGYDRIYNCAAKQSRRGDNTNETSPRRSTVLQMRQNKSSISRSGRRDPMASESSQSAPEHSGYDERKKMDTSGRVGDEFVTKVDGLRLVQTENHIPGNEIIIEPSSLTGVRKTVTRFSNLVDPELNMPGRHSEAKSRSVQYGTQELTRPTDPRISNDDMLCVDEVEDGVVGHSAEEMDSEIGQGSYYTEVDPIPIPGPPGSFLPSPRDMGLDQLDLVDGDSSESPFSTTSTISHFTGMYQERKNSEPLSSNDSQSVQEKILSRVSSCAASDALVETNAAERLTLERESFTVSNMPLERGPLIGYRSKDDQLCCCQRKDISSELLVLNYQESPLLRRRAMASVIPESMGTQMDCPNSGTNDSEIGSGTTETFSLNGFAASKPEHVSVPLKDSPDGKGKLLSCSDSGLSDSPSASNSVFRLMGKNLIVVKRDEDASPVPHDHVKPHSQMNHITSLFPTFSSGVSTTSLQNQVHGTIITGHDPYHQMREGFHGMPSTRFRSYMDPNMPPIPAREPPNLFPKQQSDGVVFSSMEPQEYNGDYHFPIPLREPASKPVGASTFHKNVDSATRGSKEVVVIDDCEVDHMDAASYSCRLRESQEASSRIFLPAASSYNSKRPYRPLYHVEQPSLVCEHQFCTTPAFTRFHLGEPMQVLSLGTVQQMVVACCSAQDPFRVTSTPSRDSL